MHTILLTGLITAVIVSLSLSVAAAGPASVAPRLQSETPDPAPPVGDGIAVGLVTYDGGRSGVCFSDEFLTTFARETGQDIHRSFVPVALDSEALFNHPFVVFSGEKAFSLSDAEKQNLKAYVDRGGFVLASAGCSNRAWADSFRAVIGELYGRDALSPLTTEHALFHTLYDIDQVQVRRNAGGPAVLGMPIDGRLRMVFSPIGLNDTGNAGGGCCCCGGNEIRNARLINANLLAYALTH
jgi:hypothetical protein